LRTLILLCVIPCVLAACDPGRARPGVAALGVALQARAGAYPIVDVQLFGSDSANVVVEDSALTMNSIATQTWMFGPPVSAAEAGECPPEKVLGQRIARELWWRLDEASRPAQVSIQVKSARRDGQMTEVVMYYYLSQLQNAWVGDTLGR
jgi:hypothetical protein